MAIDLEMMRVNKQIINLQGNDYVTHAGLLSVAGEHGLTSVTTDLISWDPEARAAVVQATVTGERGTYTDYGDANPQNVGRNIAGACIRMASTRAINRALRLYCHIGMTTKEELPGGATEPQPAKPKAKAKAKAKAKPVHDVSFEARRGSFMVQIKDLGWPSYEALCHMLESNTKPRPSALKPEQLDALLGWLGRLSPEKVASYVQDYHEDMK
jgi:hypothetical protein